MFKFISSIFNSKKFESEQNYRTLLQTIQDGVFVIQNKKFVFVNNAFLSITERTKEELIGLSILDIIHIDDKKKLEDFCNKNKKNSIRKEYELRLINKDDTISYVYITIVMGSFKGTTACMGTMRDITNRYITNKKINILKNAVKHSSTGIVITDVNGIIEYINPKFTEMTGFNIKDSIGRSTKILKSGYHDKDFYKEMWNTLLSGKEWKSEIRNKRKDGSLYWEKESISPVFDDQNEITHFIAIKDDVTQLKKLYKNLIEAKEKAEEADKLKTAFLASMSHEIRTPMNAIIGFSDLLRDENINTQDKNNYINHISNAGDSLLNLIDDIIDIAKIEAGQLKINKSVCDLGQLLDKVYETHEENKKRNEKQHIELKLNGDNIEEQLTIKTDPHRLSQILNNLIGNAIKFTEHGYIRFGYLNVNDNLLQFYVKDTGIGIPENELAHIFDRFRRVENDEKLYSGTGLGLTISKSIVELLGGKIWLESTEDVGTIFYFTLPYEKISKKLRSKQPPKRKKTYNWENKTILVAEDEKLNFLFLNEVLKKTKANIIWAKTGKQVINLYRKHLSKIDLILMDIKMPEMSGYEAMKIIREKNNEIPIIVQTAHVISGERDKSFEAGCDEYLTKPIKYMKLLETLNKYIKK